MIVNVKAHTRHGKPVRAHTRNLEKGGGVMAAHHGKINMGAEFQRIKNEKLGATPEKEKPLEVDDYDESVGHKDIPGAENAKQTGAEGSHYSWNIANFDEKKGWTKGGKKIKANKSLLSYEDRESKDNRRGELANDNAMWADYKKHGVHWDPSKKKPVVVDYKVIGNRGKPLGEGDQWSQSPTNKNWKNEKDSVRGPSKIANPTTGKNKIPYRLLRGK